MFDPDTLGRLRSPDPTVRDRAGAAVQRRQETFADGELLHTACRRLEQCAFVGLTERLADGCRLLAQTLGWKCRRRPQRLNVTPPGDKEQSIPSAAIARIRALTRLDQELYATTRALFESRLREGRRFVPA